MKKLIYRILPGTWLLLLMCLPVSAQQTGSLRGFVKDAATGEGLIGANIVVKSTYYGATTDADGFYLVQDIEPGEYAIEVSYIGYRVIQQTGVLVETAKTATLNFSLTATALALGQEIEVIGEKPLLDIEETSTVRTLSSEDIEDRIANDAMELVSQQVGVVEQDNEIHIRGGRTHEAQYLLDGISVQDPLSGTGFGLNISATAIDEVEVITGGFKAEYGQATSGIVNVRTKSGSEKHEGFFSYKSDHAGLFGDRAFSFNTDQFEFNFSGPEPFSSKLLPNIGLDLPGEIFFFINVYTFVSDDFTGATASQLRSSIAPTFNGLLDETSLAPRQNNNWSALMKLTWQISPTYKLTYAYNRSIGINQNTQSLQTNLEFVEASPGFPYDYSKLLQNFNTYTHDNEQLSLTWLHTLNKTTFYELRFSKYFAQLRSDWDGRNWADYTRPLDVARLPVIYYNPGGDPERVRIIPGDGFYDFGNATFWHDHYVDWFTVKGDITSIVAEKHSVKAGFESSYKEMQLVDIVDPWLEGGFGSSQDIYRVHPADGAFYLQDDIKFNGFFLDAGVRLDYWMPGKFVDDAIDDTTNALTEGLRQGYREDTFGFFGRRMKARLMPRLGVSHPISNNQMLYFNYGHFSKLPRPQFVYAKLGPTSSKSAFQKYGNPNLNPETSVKYELGLRHQFTRNDVLTINAYYTDIFDYVQTATISGIPRIGSGIFYINLDYARSRGLELEYKTRVGDYLSGNVSASYTTTTTKSSSPDIGLLVAQGSIAEEPITERFARWDRPWQVSANLSLDVPKGKAPTIFGLKLFSNWLLNARYFAQAGRRYTPVEFSRIDDADGRPIYETVTDQTLEFSELGTAWQWLDLSFTKYFDFGGLQYGLYFDAHNVLNNSNAAIINPVTGDAYELGDDVPSSWNDPRFPDRFFPISSPFPSNPARFRTPRNLKFGFFVKF